MSAEQQSGASLVALVRRELDQWRGWLDSPHPVITPVRLLAVILWMLTVHRPDAEEDADDAAIVEGWGAALLLACGQGVVRALDPVTLLPTQQTGAPNWVLTIADAQAFLDQMPVGFDCRGVLQHFRSDAPGTATASQSDFATWADVVAFRTSSDGKGASWDLRGQRQLLKARVAELGGGEPAYKHLATELGTDRRPLRKAAEYVSAKPRWRGPSGSAALVGALNRFHRV